MAMKLMSGRPYKHDLSDVAEIFAEYQKKGKPISKEKVIDINSSRLLSVCF